MSVSIVAHIQPIMSPFEVIVIVLKIACNPFGCLLFYC